MTTNRTSQAVVEMADWLTDTGNKEFVFWESKLSAIAEKYRRMEEVLRRIADEKQYGSDDCDYQSWLGSDHRFVSEFAQEALALDPLSHDS